MFDDFHPDSNHPQARKRLGGSMAVAIVVCVGGGFLLVSVTNKARELVKESLTQIVFAPPPPEVAPPPEKAAPKPRAKAKRAELKPPDQVPLQNPRESDQPLVQSGPVGPVEGVLDGGVGGAGTGSAPAIVPPKDLPGNGLPPYPKSAWARQVEGKVVISFDVRVDGTVANPKIVRGPEEFHAALLKAVLRWRFRPATSGGKPVEHRLTRTVTFRLEDA